MSYGFSKLKILMYDMNIVSYNYIQNFEGLPLWRMFDRQFVIA